MIILAARHKVRFFLGHKLSLTDLVNAHKFCLFYMIFLFIGTIILYLYENFVLHYAVLL